MQSGKKPRRYEIHLSSKSGPIDVYLIQDPAAAANPNDPLSSTRVIILHTVAIAEPDQSDSMMKHFDFAAEDPYNFDLKPLSDGAGDFYGFPSDVFNVFNLTNGG